MTQPAWWERRRFVLVAMLLAAVPLLWPAIPPLTDLPGHMGRYRVMLGTDADVLDAVYAFHWRIVGNLGVDLLVAALGPVIGLEPAVKVVVVAIPVLFVGAALWLSHELLGRIGPFTPFALPLAYAYPLQFGFVNYMLSVALMLAALALWLRLGRYGWLWRRAALFVGIGLAVWTAHAVGWALLTLFVVGSEWAMARQRSAGWADATVRAGIATLPLAPPALLLLVWRSGGSGGATERFLDLVVKVESIASVLRDRWFMLDVASTALLVLLLYAVGRGQVGQIDARARAAAILGSVAFLALPFTLMGSAYADARLLPAIMTVAIAGIAPIPGSAATTARRIALAATAFFVLRIVAGTASLALYDRDWRRELALVDAIPRGARVMALVGDSCAQPWAHRRTGHLPAIATVRRAAFANDQWRLDGAPLLRVRIAGIGFFAQDPSQIALDRPCHNDPNLQTQRWLLRHFPRDGFTHVWLIAPHPLHPSDLRGLSPVAQAGTSRLLRIVPPVPTPDRQRLPGRLPEPTSPL